MNSNIILHRHLKWGDTDSLFAQADHIVRRNLYWSRHTGAALDTFGCAVHYDSGSGDLTFYCNLQSYSLMRTLAHTLHLPEHRIRAVAQDVGGAFGGKFWQPRNMVVCALLAMETGRPVKFIEDRVDNLLAGDNHGENRTYDAELALTQDGKMLALRFTVVEDQGAYFLLGAGANASPMSQIGGAYDIKAIEADVTFVATNKTGQAAYRGYGAAAASFMIERLADAAADEIGLSREEIRRRNFIQPDQFPYTTPVGNVYDSGNYPEGFRRALDLLHYEEWRQRQQEARQQGRYIGIGMATIPERSVPSLTELWLLFEKPRLTATAAPETITVRIDQDGKMRVGLHTPGLGTAVETVAAMVMAEEFGLDIADITVMRLDSTLAGPSMGMAGSRMTAMLSGAANLASMELRAKMQRVAAHLLEANASDVWYNAKTRMFEVSGVPTRGVSFKQVATHANTRSLDLPTGVSSGLEATVTYDHPHATLPDAASGSWGSFNPAVGFAVHLPVVEIDPATGQVTFLDYAVLHDCGTVLSPPGVDGQILGGICQGVGSALYEELLYDDQGQMLSATFMDYLLPSSIEMPRVRIEHMETPSPFTYRGIKGAGEGGRMAAPAAIVAAIEDALRPFHIQIHSIPVTPEKIHQWIKEANHRA
jgi:CO/xanthine dehydrogenase Mo-binding subunit